MRIAAVGLYMRKTQLWSPLAFKSQQVARIFGELVAEVAPCSWRWRPERLLWLLLEATLGRKRSKTLHHVHTPTAWRPLWLHWPTQAYPAALTFCLQVFLPPPRGGPNNRHTSARPAGKESPHCRSMIPPAHQYSGQLFKWHIVGSACT